MSTPSSVQRWQEIEELFHRAVEMSGPRRQRFLEQVDKDLRLDLERLLAAEDEAGDFMEVGPRPAIPLSMPERLGPYRLLEPLGEGGAGTVYLAERDDDTFEQRVAIKILRRERVDSDLFDRFQYERQILAGFDHPYIAKILDGGSTDDGLPYFVMEHVEGLPLDEYCRTNGLDLRECLELFRKVCEAVQHAHQKLIVHRDLKPSNVLVTDTGVPKLLDFGIAKLLDTQRLPIDPTTTARWYRPLTPRYASPEQIQGTPITTRSDVYSLGMMLYELLTGRLPYHVRGHQLLEMERTVMGTVIQAPSLAVLHPPDSVHGDGNGCRQDWHPLGVSPKVVSRRLTGDLDTIVLEALRKSPARRYGSVEQLSADLRRYLEGMPIHARPDTWGYRIGKLVRRRPWETAASILFVVVSITLVTFLAIQSRRLVAERDEAQRQEAKSREMLEFVENLFYGVDPVVSGETQISAAELLEKATERLSDFDDRPEVQAALQSSFGEIYTENARYGEAIPLLRAAIETQKSWNRPLDRELAETMSRYGIALRRQLRYEEAEEVQSEVLARRLAIYGEQSPEVLSTLMNLAVIRSNSGRLQEALGTYEQVVAHFRDRDNMMHEEAASALHNMALTQLRLYRFTESEASYREAFEIRRQILGPKELYTLSSRVNLAYVLTQQRKLDTALAHLESACPGMVEIFDAGHSATMFCQLLGATIARLEGRWADAEQLLSTLEAFHPAGEGELAIWTKLAMERSRLLVEQGRADVAEPRMRFALGALGSALAEDDPLHIRAKAQWILTKVAQGQPSEEALRLQEEVLGIMEDRYSADHPGLAPGLARLAVLGARLDPRAEHLTLSDRALDLGAGLPQADTLSTLWWHRATVLRLLGREAEAQAAQEQSIAIFAERFGTDHPHLKLLKQKAYGI